MSSDIQPAASNSAPAHPLVIQGGMGIGISGWRLARAVAMRGQLGVVSGTAIDSVMVRRLQDGDPGGDVQRAMAHFPIPGVAESAHRRYFVAESAGQKTYRSLPMYKQSVSVARQQLTMLAAFVEVWLAKEGHDQPVGLNLLTKVQMPNLATLYGAMLAGVDVVLMGAGIPREIPGVLDALAEHRVASLKFDVAGDPSSVSESLTFDPRAHFPDASAPLVRPQFFAIVSASSLATTLARKATGRVDGFVIEGFTAGGHNAPPRGDMTLNERGEPIYGPRDDVDLEKIRQLGLPFWLAGSAGSPSALRAARAAGAAGVQVGTLFAYCDESGLEPDLKRRVLDSVLEGTVDVLTDPRASPTGYPFKVVRTRTIDSQDDRRTRVCDVGYLRTPYRTNSGTIGYRCSAEPVDAYVEKGGEAADTIGRRCLCNGLLANIGHPQHRAGEAEKPLITSGDDLITLGSFLRERNRYSAAEVLDYLIGGGV